MKKLTVYDATKKELIEYFFDQMTVSGVANKERFLLWLERKRTDELMEATTRAAEGSTKALNEYIQYIKMANDELKDIDKKLELLKKADKAYKRYEKFNDEYDKADKKFMERIND